MNTPNIRFKGYTDAWEQRKLGELVNIGDIDHRMPKTVECGIPYLMTGDFCGINELNFDGVKHISEEDYEQLSRKIKPEKNDILFARYASVGAVRYVDFTDKFLISYSCAIIKHGDKIYSKYLYHYLTSDIAQRQIALEINTGSQANIGIDSMKNNILVQMPCVDEQRTVASYLDSLDNLIALHQSKCDDLQEVKKYMLQKLFPQNGAKIPEIRFAGFTGEWEQRKLGDVFQEYSEKRHEELPPLTIFQGGGTILREESDRNLQYDKSSLSNYKMVKKDDFIVHLRSFEGGLEKANSDGIISPAYHTLHGENTDSRFYYPFFRSREFIEVLLKPHVYGIRDGKSIDIEGMKTINIPVPSLEEQQRIGEYIEQMDNLISLQQNRCDNLKEVKKFMLQNMFPRREASPMGEG